MQESIFLGHDQQLETDIVNLFSGYTSLRFKKGEVITSSDQPSSTIFCMESGFIIVYAISPKGQRDVRSIGGGTCIFPVKNFFAPQHADEFMPSRDVYFEALTDCSVLCIPEKDFLLHVAESAVMQVAMLKQFSMNHRLSMARIEMMQLRDIRLRIASFFLSLALSFGKKQGTGYYIQVPLSHQLIADCISTARETVTREIAQLKKANLVVPVRGHFLLPDIDALRQSIKSY